MITADHPLIQWLALIDMVWIEADVGQLKRGGPKFYSEQMMFKVYVVSVLKQLWAHRSVWRYLSRMPLVAAACGLVRLPDRRTLDRRLAEIAPQAEAQIQALGLVLLLEAVTDATVAVRMGRRLLRRDRCGTRRIKKLALSRKDCMARTPKRTGLPRRITAGCMAIKRTYPSVSPPRRSGSCWEPRPQAAPAKVTSCKFG